MNGWYTKARFSFNVSPPPTPTSKKHFYEKGTCDGRRYGGYAGYGQSPNYFRLYQRLGWWQHIRLFYFGQQHVWFG
ncbi:hypothetical protein GCM10011383_06590 [Hymenobacter cavernae]|uniref:Uncharacterized protein n=1 Tax=Hymenobacter cavernae TaxID=2044852 RepID=A0ABQ1TLR3_9BACT|nr:hypothetical protein GCM10011383_06590 [Hymenobacter cavernae]